MSKYAIEDTTLMDIAEKIRYHNENTEKITPEEIPDKIDLMAETKVNQGKKDAYDSFWDAFQDYGKRADNRYICSYFNFTPETFKPKYPIKLSSYAFDNCRLNISLIQHGVTFAPPAHASTSLGYCFRNTKITELPAIDASLGNSMFLAFSNSDQLKKIEKIVSSEKTSYESAFGGTTSLKEIRFEGSIGTNISFSGSPLSKESILSIITHLSDVETTRTLTLKSSVAEGVDWSNTVIDDVTYNTFDEICDLKPNWTISLV